MNEDKKILILACGALAREILALIEINDWAHMELQCIPAKLHLYPEKIPQAVREAVAQYRGEYDEIFLAFADCGTGGLLQKTADELGVEMIEGPHCYSFFDGNEQFAARGEVTAFYLTDFLTRQFEAFVWQPMGFDKHPELIEVMFGNYEKLVYLAQTEDAELDAKAQDAAKRLGLDYERRFTGYGDLQKALQGVAS